MNDEFKVIVLDEKIKDECKANVFSYFVCDYEGCGAEDGWPL